ncbi:MAG: S-adenosylmethionine decarboxylase [Ideonella sp.]|nr:S-adenosylmethionine decarboxylase [Ideonella sp.]MCC7456613.1 S-adenosylmethionine decarboxylase [Nitrospira sp.]
MRGLHLTADLFGCRDPEDLMRDGARLASICERLAREAGLSVVGRQFHAFVPVADAGNAALGAAANVDTSSAAVNVDNTGATGGGLTGVLLLAESHLALHTWPELGAVTLDVFVCNFVADNSHKARRLVDALVPLFDASRVERQQLVRGAATPPAP